MRRLDRNFSAGLRPYGLAISPDGRWAAVASIGRGNGDEDTASLIDMTGPPATWRVVHTITVGQIAEGIQVSPDGRIVEVTVMDGSNKPDARVGTWAQGVAFSRDGRRLVVGNMVENNLTVLSVAADGALAEGGPPIAVPSGSAALRTAEL